MRPPTCPLCGRQMPENQEPSALRDHLERRHLVTSTLERDRLIRDAFRRSELAG